MSEPSVPIQQFPGHVSKLRDTFDSGVTRSYEWRVKQIKAMKQMMVENEDLWLSSQAADLGKPSVQAGLDISNVIAACDELLNHLKSFMKAEMLPTYGLLAPSRMEVRREPFGVVLVIGPYNYPIILCLKPIIGALAAGNTCMLKPSEMTPETSKTFSTLFPKFFDSSVVKVIEGGIPETTALLATPFDFFFFTGSTRVGRIVAEAAAKHIKPCVLELGGKNPVIVDEHLQSIDVAARRIAWGQTWNCGQTCVAPGYVLVMRKHAEELKRKVVHYLKEFYGEDPEKSKDFSRQASENGCLRVQKLLSDRPGEILCGGKIVPQSRYIAPTVLSETPLDSEIMGEELFAPVLSINTVDSIDEAIKIAKQVCDKPLNLMIFSSNTATAEKCILGMQSGGVCVNDVMAIPTTPNCAFGGIGNSGMGSYQGKYSLDTFSHKRTIVSSQLNYNTALTDPPLRYAPFTESKAKMFLWAADNLPNIPPITWAGIMKVVAATALLSAGVKVLAGL
mmetsp:Transcript_25272/g.51429  ORF Transcript_25272/g.51429 Transcript_25272/m.51429 type:complete len:506 (-) Transcript_25272:30-1547(-)|eukprot:CAMPEP_0181328438 /NCGR_PEP_ID=MMETSP1101-20121128/22713_1 /TAXON_ID=46948 /ORGANISM="Rhodomonas abbreviata, Strain Caron Lab Isolate" /LENGTH=505 /DNA_ID=CAMNT_0023437321 /DNA_START=179 /DNA_END=1696 /DNA_ORIENTATION=-